ncbi:Peptidase M35 deuterolysin [Penicillium cf. griseofulvum]|uniref:Neutral protease 2 n=1 Tax=Penicillium cf. griseofulvum TaxID=2972120 RepID=A0A9W9MGH1_9EURO|nr:Peptidase M35 deuterolysin [Penicillium cf. griseofulvum]KAJ5423132.1 Peptidase M35 deuterolysin [Penicillium cf. griseofulvum]KAJ5431604.1 Peptidase M35 deuterolysin [Penicillium cf. griseofulvum]
MRFAALSTTLLALAVNALPVDTDDTSALDITLSRVSDTRIKAVVKNSGNEDVTFVHLNFFRDSAPVKKVNVFKNDAEVAFEGIKRRFVLKGLTEESLTSLAAGETFEDEFDIAATTDLSSGGPLTLQSTGLVPLVTDGAVTGYLPYRSNDLKIEVDGAKASRVLKAIKPLDRRALQTCSDSSKKSALSTALKNTVKLASAAATAASSGSASKFQEYFKTTSTATRQVVANRLKAVAAEAGSVSATKYYCSDTLGYCEPNVLAYTLPSQNVIANCDLYYTDLPALASRCHAQDQATTTLHEFTHAPGVYSPGTDDLGYGYDAATGLSSADAVMNADSYALYANG